MSERRLVVVSAGLGQPSATRLLADRLASGTERALREAGLEPRTETIEARDHAQDLVNNLLTGFPSPRLRAAIDAVVGADGLICVSPIFNASYSGLFKTFCDVIERDSLAGKPVLIAATGGTARHSLALEHAFRPLFAYLGAAVVPIAVYAAAQDWGDAGETAEDPLSQRIYRAARELARFMIALAPEARQDQLADPVPFEELLGSVGSASRVSDRLADTPAD